MRLFLDTYTRLFYSSVSAQVPTISVSLKRRDLERIEVVFWDERQTVNLPTSANGKIGLKKLNDFEGDYLAFSDGWTVGGTEQSRKYTFSLNLNTVEMEAEFTPGVSQVEAMLEISWSTSAGTLFSSTTLPCRVFNDVIQGSEGEPVELPLFYAVENADFRATQAEAEDGTNNSKWMSPLRVVQTLAAKISSFLTWANITGKPTSFPPSSHGHEISDINALQDELDNKVGNLNPEIYESLSVINGEATQIFPSFIRNDFGPTIIEFEEARLEYAGNDVINWGTAGQLSIGNRVLKDLGAPVAANDAVRKTDLDGKVTNAGGIARIERVTSMPSFPEADTLYIVIP